MADHENPAGGEGGALYVVATPIGDFRDITLRAMDVLRSVDLVAAEDTRKTGQLLAAHGIDTRMVSCHDHNESQRAEGLVDRIRAGGSVALVSDAGTPSLSDPGYRLVCTAIDAGLSVVPVPGPSAAMAALSVSGLPTDAFVFIGFPPKKPAKRAAILRSLAGESRTLIFYESPRRIIPLLNDALQELGDREGVACREMTKPHEEFLRGRLSSIRRRLAKREAVKGELTLLVAGHTASSPGEGKSGEELTAALFSALQEPGARVSAVSRSIANRLGLPRNQVYEAALEIQNEIDRTSNRKGEDHGQA
jgi:16S rRNA (cytidine1402-2'-O)-methyltransferase